MWHFWNYVDVSKLALACRLDVEAETGDANVEHMTAKDGAVSHAAELARTVFGDVEWATSSATGSK